MLCQDFLNNYFLTNAERIRHDKDHVVLHVPKEGPASAEMVPRIEFQKPKRDMLHKTK
jgi:hypothetical protein